VVEVSLFVPGSATLATVHDASGQPTQISAPGDHSGEDFVAASTSKMRPLIAGLDVSGAKPRPVVVAYGDSITDNTGCANDAVPVCRWGDVLGRRLAKAGMPQVVVTQAISGNRILAPGTGPSALARFDRDVLAIPGVSHVLILEGINDIGNSGRDRGVPAATAEQLILGLRQLVVRAHDRGIKVIAMTILPFQGAGYSTPEGEAIRVQVNDAPFGGVRRRDRYGESGGGPGQPEAAGGCAADRGQSPSRRPRRDEDGRGDRPGVVPLAQNYRRQGAPTTPLREACIL
jgi:lysophospholipase L1-like esterase